jgi:Flp pilus assembly protein TadG
MPSMSKLLRVGSNALAARVRGLRHDGRGVAAVEFAALLPFMLAIYFGSTELTQALMASRKATIASRAISDLVAQQQNNTTLTDTQVNEVLNAATAIMSPFSSTNLKVTITSVEFVVNAGATYGYDAKPRWTIVANGGAARPCQKLTPVANNTTPTVSTLPSGIYANGSVIIADVVYTYTPTFGSSLFNTQQGLLNSITYRHTTYMRPRSATGVIPYSGTMGTVCPAY